MQFFFIASLTIFNCLLLYKEPNSTFKISGFVQDFLAHSSFPVEENLKDLIPTIKGKEIRISGKIAKCNGKKYPELYQGLDLATNLALLIAGRKREGLSKLENKNLICYSFVKFSYLVSSNLSNGLREFMQALIIDLVNWHILVFDSKQTQPWIEFGDPDRSILVTRFQKDETFFLNLNPYSVRINAALSLLGGLGRYAK